MKSSPNIIHSDDPRIRPMQWTPAVLGETPVDTGKAKAGAAAPTPGFDQAFPFPELASAGNGAVKTQPVIEAPMRSSTKSPASRPATVEPQPARPFFLDPPQVPAHTRYVRAEEADETINFWQPQEFCTDESPAPSEPPDFDALREQLVTETLALARIQAQEQTERMLRVAREQADAIAQKALGEASEVTRQAYREGIASAQAEASEMLSLARNLVEEVRHWREEMLKQSEPLVIGMVQTIATKLFSKGFVLEQAVLKQAFETALTEAKTLGDLRIRAHPEDVAILDPLWPSQMTALTGQKIDLVPNQDIERGCCFIEGQFGSVDGRVKTQLRLVNETLGRVLAEDVLPTNPFTTYEETPQTGD